MNQSLYKMRKNVFSRICLGLMFIGTPFITSAQQEYAREDCDVEQAIFKLNDYDYELWQSNTVSDACMKTQKNGDFTVSWSSINNTLARKGKRPGLPNQQINYSVNSTFTGNVFYGAYGWWRTPGETGIASAVEYYVVENYGVNKPTDGGDLAGIVSSDGADYEVYIIPKYGQPNVYGINDFTQIKCIRVKDKLRSSGSITMANHFNKWASLGWPVGDLYEVSMKIEGYSNGPQDPTAGKADIIVDMATSGTYVGSSNDKAKRGKNVAAKGPLSGTYFLKSYFGGRYATANNINLSEVKENIQEKTWSSQHWKFIFVNKNEYRLKELYGGRYLKGNSNGTIVVADLDKKDKSQIWEIEKKGKKIRFRNKKYNKYLTNTNAQWGTILSKESDKTVSQKWQLIAL